MVGGHVLDTDRKCGRQDWGCQEEGSGGHDQAMHLVAGSLATSASSEQQC